MKKEKLTAHEKFLIFNLLNEVEDKGRDEKRAIKKLERVI